MIVAPILAALLVVAPASPARESLGQIALDVGSGTAVEADACPVVGEYRVRIESTDPGLASRILASNGGVVRSASAKTENGGMLATFQLDPEARFAVATVGEEGELILRFEGLAPGTAEPSLTEVLQSSVVGRNKLSMADGKGYLPLGEGSPWSFVSFPLYPPVIEPFVPVAAIAAPNDPVPPLVLTPDLLDGSEVRKVASVEGGAWWFEAVDRFIVAASLLGDDPTHEAALALAGEALYLSGGNDESFEYFDRTLASYPDSPRAAWYLFGRGLALQGMGRHVDALEDLEAAVQQLPSADRGMPLAAMVASLASIRRWDAAFELSETLHRGWPDTFFDPWLEAELAYRAEDIARTVELLESLEKHDDARRPLVLLRLADCSWLRDDSEAFLYWLASARSAGDSSAAIMARLRRLEWQILGGEEVSFPTVIAELRAVASTEPRAGLEVALAEAQYLHERDMFLEASRVDLDTLRNYPDFPSADVVETRMCRAADALMQVAHESNDTLYEAGIYLDFVDGRQARACADPALLRRGITALESLGLWDEARRSLSALMVHDRVTPTEREGVVLRLARLYLEMGRIADGLKTIDYYWKNLDTHTRKLEADLLRAELVLARGGAEDVELALELGESLARASLPTDQRRRAARLEGLAAYRLEKWDDSADSFARARAVDGVQGQDESWHQDGLLQGWSLIRADRVEDARSVLEGLDPAQLTPAAGTVHRYLLARVYRELGRGDDAEALLEAVAASSEPSVWTDFSRLELDDLAWTRRFEELVSVPEPGRAGPNPAEQGASEL